jgi:uncharacterized repeat protein (TIGR01451 family)
MKSKAIIALFSLLAILAAPAAQAHTTITKTTSTPSVAIGGTATYTIKADATGTSSAVIGLQLKDTLPIGMSYLSTTSVTLLNPNATRTAVVNPVVGATTPIWGTFTNVLASGGNPAGAEQIVFTALVGPATACGINTNTVIQSAGNVHTNTNATNTAPITVTGVGVANLVVSKVTTTPTVAKGGTAGYTITVSNIAAAGSCPATGVTISDTLPTNFTYAATGTIALAGGTLRSGTTIPAVGATAPVWGSFTIPPGGSITLPFTAKVAAGTASGTYNNSASTATTAAGPTITNFNGALAGNTADNVTVVNATNPSLTKVFAPTSIVIGQTTKLIFTIDNSAATNINRTGVKFTDTLQAGITIANPPAPSSVNCGTPTYTAVDTTQAFTATNISVAAGAICTITLTVKAVLPVARPVADRTNGSGDISNRTRLTNNVTDQILTVTNPVAPTIAKSFSPNPVASSVPTVLTFTLNNPNPVPIAAVTFTDTFPTTPTPGMKIDTPLATTNTCGGTLFNNLGGALAAGNLGIRLTGGVMPANSSCTISVKVLTTAIGNYVNTTGAVATTNNTVTSTGLTATSTLNVLASVPPFIAKAFSPTAVGTGEVSTLTFTITNPNNSGVGTIAGVAFGDTYPAGLVNAPTPNVVNSCGGSITGGAAGGNTIGLTLGSIPFNSSCTISVDVVAATANTYNNTSGAVSSTTTTPFVIGTGNTANAKLTVLPKPTISKAFADPYIVLNGITTLTLTLTNPSTTIPLTNVAFTDTFPANLKVATPGLLASDCGGTATAVDASGSVSLIGGSIGVNSSCTISVDVTSSVAGHYSNTTSGVSSTQTGGAGTVSNTEILDVLASPTISKAFVPSAIPVNGASTLTITITNPNAIALSGLDFLDTLPVGLVVAPAPNSTSTCGDVFVPAPGDLSLNLNASGIIAANATCEVTVDVTSATAGNYPNTSGGVSSTETGAAGTGSNTAILNVVNKPTIAKSFLPTSVPVGSPSTLTLVITNPNSIGLTDLDFTDTFPANLVVATTPNFSNTCGGTLAPVAGDIAINLIAGTVAGTVPTPTSNTCTIKVDVSSSIAASYPNTSGGVASTESGAAGAVSNTATLTVIVSGVPVSGFVYSDVNHNIQKDSTETGTPLTLYAKLVPLAGGPALQAVLVTAVTGAYQFPTVTAGQYSIVIDDNATLADITPTITAGWIGTEMPNFTRANVLVAATALQNLNFGLFNGSKLSGTVFADTGITGGTANNGVKDGGELGIAGVTLKASTGATTHDTAITDGAGNYTLWIPAAAVSPVLITETNLSNNLSTGGSVGNTAGTYTRTTDITSFTITTGIVYTNVNFGDVPVNRFAANELQSGLPGNVLFYSHQFDAGSGGSIVFSAVSAPAWPTILYRDLNCNGAVDAGDTVISAALTVAASAQVCIVDKVTIPTGTGLGLQAIATVQAVFTYTNASPALSSTLSVIDTTTVGAVAAGLVLKKTVDKATALPNDTVTYTLTYQNNSNVPLASIVINDATPAFTTFLSASCVLPLPTAITACVALPVPAVAGVGTIKWTLTGTLSPASTGQVRYSVKVSN